MNNEEILNNAIRNTISFKNFHRCLPPGIQDWRSLDGPYNLVKLVPDNAVMMEVGVYYGESAMFFLLSQKFSKIIGVDPFGDDPLENQGYFPEDLGKSFIDGVVSKSNGIVELWRHKSCDAIPLLPNNSLDLIYIDGNHSYEAVSQDIKLAIPKMKKGGIISGHDYTEITVPGVKKAVDEAFGKPHQIYTDGSWMVKLA